MAKKAKIKTRASNGMGSIRQRPDGRWEARYTTPDGRQRSVYAKTEAEVTKKLRGELHTLDAGIWSEPSRITVADWMQAWLSDYQAHTSARTRQTYGNMVRLHINPVIGELKLIKVLPLHVRRVVNAMTDKGLSANYIHHCHGVMSVSFNAAIEAGILKTNPAKGIKTPRIVRRRLNIIDRELIPAFIDAAHNHLHGLAMVFLLLTGLRAAEQRGLKWDDIDFEKHQLHIQRQLPCKFQGKAEFIPPKDGSTRTIELPPEAVDLLRQQRKKQAEQRLAAGSRWMTGPVVDNLVFRTSRGYFLSEGVLFNAVRDIGKQIGMPALHPHDLRHSYAVAALRSGIDIKTVQNNLGHKNAAMTLDVYAAYTTDAGKVGAERFSEYWQDALKNS